MNEAPAGVKIMADDQGNPVPSQLYAAGAGHFGVWATDGGDVTTDGHGVMMAYPRFRLADAPNRGFINVNGFWNNAAVLAAGQSAAIQPALVWGKGAIFATASAATNITMQYSLDGAAWFDVTQDNAGTLWTLALVAGHLSAYRDLPGFPPQYIRLVSSGAATITAGLTMLGV